MGLSQKRNPMDSFIFCRKVFIFLFSIGIFILNLSTPVLTFAVNTDTSENLTETSNTTVDKPFLLPSAVKPITYRLEIIPLLFKVDDEASPYYNLSRFSAPGKVWIKVEYVETTSNITLHAHEDIKIVEDKITVTNAQTNKTIILKNVTRDKDTDFVVLHLGEPIGSGGGLGEVFHIYVEFTGRIADDRLNGLYLDYYTEPKTKEKRYLSTTLFAPNHARKAFPCFDEPGFKATFDISIGRKIESGYTSISNMPLLKTMPIPEANGWVFDVFHQTIPIPTYIVALITTDFKYRSVKNGDVELRLYAPEHLLQRTKQLNYSERIDNKIHQNPYTIQDPLLLIQNLLEKYNTLTDLGKFPLPKLDIVALPHFFFSAMENIGAMTFKYPVILNVDNSTTTSALLRIASVAGHEVAHQWFGNTLTPKSWTYVWLKEGFSDLFSSIYLSQKMDIVDYENMVNKELQVALRFDGGADTHPLENHVKTPASVGEIYTHIPYRKGNSILHMTSNFLTAPVFHQGLKRLFAEKRYSNIDQNDLFHVLEESQLEHRILANQGLDNVTVADILNTWTQQSGYPVIRATQNGSDLVLSQKKFINGLLEELNAKEKADQHNTTSSDPESKVNEDDKDLYWWIPVFLDKSSGNHSVHWMAPSDGEHIAKNVNFKVNSIRSTLGYHRTLYSKSELQSILQAISRRYHSRKLGAHSQSDIGLSQSRSLRPAELSQLMDDYFALAFAKYEEVPVSLLFHLMSVILPYEGEYVVWNTVLENIRKPYLLLQNTEYFPSFQEYMMHHLNPLRNFLQSQFPTVSKSPCSYAPALLQKMKLNQFHSLVLKWSCDIQPSECAQMSRKSLSKFIKSGDISSIPADEQSALYCNAVKTATDDTELEPIWNFFEKLYFEEPYPVQRDRYLNALSCVGKEEYLQRLLKWTVNDTLDLHDVDKVTLLRDIIANPVGRANVFKFLDENFVALYKTNSVANPVTEALKEMVDYVNSNEKLEEMESFISKHSEAMEKKKKFLEKQVKNAKLNILWMNSFAKAIQDSATLHLESFSQQDSCDFESDTDFEMYIHNIVNWH